MGNWEPDFFTIQIFDMRICKCNQCNGLFDDLNPQVDAREYPELPFRMLSRHLDDGWPFWGCPECKTDEYLADVNVELPELVVTVGARSVLVFDREGEIDLGQLGYKRIGFEWSRPTTPHDTKESVESGIFVHFLKQNT